MVGRLAKVLVRMNVAWTVTVVERLEAVLYDMEWPSIDIFHYNLWLDGWLRYVPRAERHDVRHIPVEETGRGYQMMRQLIQDAEYDQNDHTVTERQRELDSQVCESC